MPSGKLKHGNGPSSGEGTKSSFSQQTAAGRHTGAQDLDIGFRIAEQIAAKARLGAGFF